MKARLRSRLAARSRQRGAALFVVLLVITLLMGIGAFAARSSHLAVAASGADKKATQARYVAEYGLMFATAKLSNGGAQSYLQQMRRPANIDVCYGQNALSPQRTCYRMFSSMIQGELAAEGFKVCDLASGSTPGSFGTSNAECAFSVELSDLSEGAVLPGFDLAGGKALRFWYVTASSVGQVRLFNTGGANLDASSAESSVTSTIRGRILTGPFPTN
jgi:hypothetical protein